MTAVAVALDGDPQRARLEHRAQLADLAQLGRVVLEDEGSALRPDLDQPLGLQPQERLAHRRAADAELLGKRLLGKLFAKSELVGDDQVADLLDHKRPQRSRPRDALDDVRCRLRVHHAAPGHVTGVRAPRPSNQETRLSTTQSPMALAVSSVELATCGVSTTLSSAASRAGTFGSS